MKVKRLIGIVFYLLSKKLVSSRELAEHFDVSVRTILRDMDYLSEAGIPIVSEMGKDGGFGIMDTYKLDARLVDNEDLFYIMTSLESISSTYTDERLESTIIKLKGLLSDQSTLIQEKKERLRFDFSSLKVKDDDNSKMESLSQAIDNSKVISFDYTNFKGAKTSRIVEPHMIMFKWYSWYLYSFCTLREEFRVFRVSRMSELKLLDKKFHRKDFDVNALDKDYQIKTTNISTHIVLKFDMEMKYIVDDYFKEWKKEYTDNAIIVHFIVPIDNWFFGMVMSYGDSVEIIEPAYLRDELSQRLDKIKNIYTPNNI